MDPGVAPHHGAPSIQPMKRWRVWVVFGLVTLLVAGHGIDIGAQREHWPFSHYPMYARAEKKKRQELLSLFGTMRAPGYRAMVRLTDPNYVPPLNEGRLRVILMAAYRRGATEQNLADARRVMADYMRAYEARRVAGLYDGPRMTEVHLYRLTWKLRPDGTHASAPWRREPLLTVRWDDLERRRPTTKPVELPAQPPNDDDD
jgi:hypothetical protein